jgi:ubiquinone/menaquinone biosynthesis C-methylase UbiE
MAQDVQNPLFARFFDRFCGRDRGNGERDLRVELLAGATGRLVEVGPGNGINFPHYPRSVAEVIAVEPEPYLRSQAEKAATHAPVRVQVMPGLADALELAPDSVDAVVACGVLCSVPDQDAALAEFRRVLRPGGELRFYEHVRSRRPGFAAAFPSLRTRASTPSRHGSSDSRAPTEPPRRQIPRSAPPSTAIAVPVM